MKKEQLFYLIRKFRNHTITDKELCILKNYSKDSRFEKIFIEVVDELSEEDGSEPSLVRSEKMFSKILMATHPKAVVKSKYYRINKWHLAGVAALLMMFFKLFFFHQSNDAKSIILTENKEVIFPGSSKARVLMEDGSSVNLDSLSVDNSLYFDGYSISINEYGELFYTISPTLPKNEKVYNTIVTPKGGEYVLNLPDGTKVSINADSKLKYPLSFGEFSRTVELEGEAFFEVNKLGSEANLVPFIVQTGQQHIEVLGTQFNVNCYTNEIQTTLVEGKVKLLIDGNQTKYLMPNQQATFNSDNNIISIKEVDPFYTIAWKSGSFAFDNSSLQSVMESLGRWYDVSVDYETDIKDIKFSGRISKYEHIEKVLAIIEKTKSVKFKIEGRRVIVMK